MGIGSTILPRRYSFYYVELGCYLSVGAEFNWPYRVLDIHLPFCHLRFGRAWLDGEAEIPHRRLWLLDLDTTDGDVGPGAWAMGQLSLHDWWVGLDIAYDHPGELDVEIGVPGLTISFGGRTGAMRRNKERVLAPPSL